MLERQKPRRKRRPSRGAEGHHKVTHLGLVFAAQWALGSKVRSATPRAIKDSGTDGSRRFLLGAITVRRRSSPEIHDGCRGPLTRRLSGPGTMHGSLSAAPPSPPRRCCATSTRRFCGDVHQRVRRGMLRRLGNGARQRPVRPDMQNSSNIPRPAPSMPGGLTQDES